MDAVPLIGFPKPNFNKWIDFTIQELNMLAINEAYDGISISTTAIQAERNENNLTNNFNFLSFYPSVDINTVGTFETAQEVSMNIPYKHFPSGQIVDTETLVREGYITSFELDLNQQEAENIDLRIEAAAAEYFADIFSRDTNTYEFNNYVDSVRLVGMSDGFISKDMTLKLKEDSDIVGHITEGANYQGDVVEDFGSLTSVLPQDMANLIIGQIENGIRSPLKDQILI